MIYKVEAILIRSMDYGEGHQIITLYTPHYGKVSVMARGAKKLKNRYTGAVQLFTHAEYTYFKNGNMGTLNHAEILYSHEALRTDIVKTAYASYLSEMVYRLVTDDEKGSSYLFSQLAAAFQELCQDKDAQIIAHIFELKMLEKAGYSPVLSHCAICGKKSDLNCFDASAGGMICISCAKNAEYKMLQVDKKTHMLLNVLQKVDLRRVGNITISAQTKQNIARVMRLFMEYYADVHHWKSRKFLDQMQKHFFGI